MFIRDIQAQDQAIYMQMSKDFYHSDATLFAMTDEQLQATLQKALQNSPFLRLVIIEEEQKTVGYSLLAFYWSNEAGGMVTQLEEFYVLPEYRGKQLGSQFLNWLIDSYRDQTARFRLEICSSNVGAKKLYEKYGFSTLDYIQMIKDMQ